LNCILQTGFLNQLQSPFRELIYGLSDSKKKLETIRTKDNSSSCTKLIDAPDIEEKGGNTDDSQYFQDCWSVHESSWRSFWWEDDGSNVTNHELRSRVAKKRSKNRRRRIENVVHQSPDSTKPFLPPYDSSANNTDHIPNTYIFHLDAPTIDSSFLENNLNLGLQFEILQGSTIRVKQFLHREYISSGLEDTRGIAERSGLISIGDYLLRVCYGDIEIDMSFLGLEQKIEVIQNLELRNKVTVVGTLG